MPQSKLGIKDRFVKFPSFVELCFSFGILEALRTRSRLAAAVHSGGHRTVISGKIQQIKLALELTQDVD